MMHHMLISALAGALICAAGGCQLHPRPVEAGNEILPPPPTPAKPYQVSDMRIQTIGATTFVYSTIHTSFENMSAPTAERIASLKRAASSGQIGPTSILLIYHDPTENPAEPFDLDVGISVFDKRAAADQGLDDKKNGNVGISVLDMTTTSSAFKVRKLPPFHCATAKYRGPMRLLPRAYDTLIPEMIAAGLIPSQETRESYLVWESPDSPNNVVQIEVGIE